MTGRRVWWLAVALFGLACGSGGSTSTTGETRHEARQVRGTVSGAPSGVTLTLSCSAPATSRTTVTDAQGRFGFDRISTEACSLAPQRTGYRFDPASVSLPAGETSPTDVAFTARPALQVWGADMGSGWVNLHVAVAGDEVGDADVRINGQVIPFLPALGSYSAELDALVPAGERLSLEVTRGGATVTGTGLVPEAPVLTAPSTGEYRSSGQDLLVTWTSETSPDEFHVIAKWSCGPSCGTGTLFQAPGTSRSLTIPAGSLPAGEVELVVFAYDDGELTGDYEPHEAYPGMNIRSESGSALLTIGAASGRRVSGQVLGGDAGVRVGLACPGMAERSVPTEADGAYAFEAVPATSCTVTPEGAGYAFDPPGVTLASGGADQEQVRFVARPMLQVRGTAIVSYAANVAVLHAGRRVEGATVRLNGQVAPFLPAVGVYHLAWAVPLAAGDRVSLEVTSGTASVVGEGTFPEAPLLIAPADSASFSSATDVVVRWSSATSPDGFLVSVGWSCGPSCGAGMDFPAPGSARSLTLPAGELPEGTVTVSVSAVNDGVLTGDYDDSLLDPGMNLRAASARVSVLR